MEKFAIVSVYEKKGLLPLAQCLKKHGYQILSTGGTAEFLKSSGVEVIQISDFTGYPEICDGRVKSLHPKVHGGVLARRDNPRDLEQLRGVESGVIDFVVVNLYPFTQKVEEHRQSGSEESLVEYIDIGGPTLIRGAAKNWRFVTALSDAADYEQVITELEEGGAVSEKTRQTLAAKVFTTMAAYDGAIARYLSLGESVAEAALAPVESITLREVMPLRYGENPHQRAALYRPVRAGMADPAPLWNQLQGKELSYNNLIDFQAALELFLEVRDGFPKDHAAVIIKHMNPCGAALGKSPLDAFKRARACDPVSAFGGIIVQSGKVSRDLVEEVLGGFVEIFIAEEFDRAALDLFATKKNIRVIQGKFDELKTAFGPNRIQVRDLCGDYLIQSADASLAPVRADRIVSGELTGEGMLRDLDFAWRVSKFVKSNAIVLAKDGQAIGVGAGQMSRVDSARLSLERARSNGFDPAGAVAASDAFLPFSDTLEILAAGGVKGLVQPGGSLRDSDVVDVARRLDVVMVLTGERHFRH
jgi:phosphoribosylaminoimidazolecarboxamide formyltransferase/IMP cyclohydrolase